MNEDKLFKDISEIVEKHIKQIWITPSYKRLLIPNEEIWNLKRDLVDYIKGGRKNGD